METFRSFDLDITESIDTLTIRSPTEECSSVIIDSIQTIHPSNITIEYSDGPSYNPRYAFSDLVDDHTNDSTCDDEVSRPIEQRADEDPFNSSKLPSLKQQREYQKRRYRRYKKYATIIHSNIDLSTLIMRDPALKEEHVSQIASQLGKISILL